MIIDEKDYLAHYGILRKSGRYPWGSGGNVPQRSRTFLDHIRNLFNKGLSEAEVASGVGMTTTELRAAKSIANNQVKQYNIAWAQRLHDKGLSNVAIGTKMGLNESSVRNLLKPGEKEKADNLQSIANMLKDQVAEKTYVDIGKGVENKLAVSKTKLDTAVAILKEDGKYVVHNVQVPTTGQNMTTVKVLAPPGTTYMDVKKNLDKIRQIQEKSDDGGRSFLGLLPPLQVDSKRIAINYAEDGGDKADGVIYVRPGVEDLSLGKGRYAQVRIAVDGSHYLKGMAMYKDDLPPGVDLVFNTNKSDTGNKLDAMKPLKKDKVTGEIDQDNPFGSVVDQIKLRDAFGKEVRDAEGKGIVTSAMNLVNEEGDWDKWSKTLSSQMLSKQSTKLAKEQLAVTYEARRKDLDEILSMTNPVIKRKLLTTFADDADAASVHLKAAHMPRQRAQVILPINSLKENEIYAPNFINGERVVLIRHPHGGIFEIPELVVNNNHRVAKGILGQATDAVGINSKVAARLSGADFDGDTVLVIPNNHGKIKTAPALEGLKNFDPIRQYKDESVPRISPARKQTEMGIISNLITDMTIRGATNDELARAVRHSMVVIDSEKHHLDYKRSAAENGILALKKKYQGVDNDSKRTGAATLISRAKSRKDIDARKPRPARQGGPIDPATGKRVWVDKGTPYLNKKGVLVKPQQQVKKLEVVDDAFELVSSPSGTRIEAIYAEHSNKLKALANEARKASINTPTLKQSPSAKVTYKNEVESLNHKLDIAFQNAPLERQARIIANNTVSQKKADNPEMDKAELKKLEFLALTEARNRTGAKKQQVYITDAEWEAIQAGAISHSKLKDIIDNADIDRVKELATPRPKLLMGGAQKRRAASMLASGYSQAEVALALGVSLSTLKESLKGDG